MAEKRTRSGKFITDLCVGGAAAVVSKTAVAPIERVKLLLQVQHTYSGIATDRRFTGITDALIRIPKEQGFLSFWRGNATNVVRYFPTQALNFAFNDFFRSHLVRPDGTGASHLARSMAAGGLAGSITMCFVYPLDFIRTRISVDVGRNKENREYRGIVDCARKTIHSDGILGLYRGFFISIQTYFIYRAVYFGLYDTLRRQYEGVNPLTTSTSTSDPTRPRRIPFVASFLLAETVTVCASYLTYPYDTVRRRMMIKGELHKSSSLDAVKRILKSEGVLGLYKGAFANVLRSTGSALVMALYHEIQDLIR